MKIYKIVVTGGPCAGKSTAIKWIKEAFTEKGYIVLFVPETATELIGGGVAPWTCSTVLEYQTYQLRLQLEKEKIFEQAAKGMDSDKILIICDRGAMDNKAYMDIEDFETMLKNMQLNEEKLRDCYDAVFHLVTAAKGGEKFYTTENNSARTETVEKACEMDDKLISAWTGHPYLRMIENSPSFEKKMNHLITEIETFLITQNK